MLLHPNVFHLARASHPSIHPSVHLVSVNPVFTLDRWRDFHSTYDSLWEAPGGTERQFRVSDQPHVYDLDCGRKEEYLEKSYTLVKIVENVECDKMISGSSCYICILILIWLITPTENVHVPFEKRLFLASAKLAHLTFVRVTVWCDSVVNRYDTIALMWLNGATDNVKALLEPHQRKSKLQFCMWHIWMCIQGTYSRGVFICSLCVGNWIKTPKEFREKCREIQRTQQFCYTFFIL